MNLKALPREKLLQTIAYYIGFIALGLAMVSTGPALPNLLLHTGSTVDAFAIVLTISSVGFMVGSYAGGWLFDRIKGNLVIGTCFVFIALTLAVTPLITTLWLMSVVMFINAFAMSLIDLGSNTLLTWVHGEGDQGAAYMNALHFFFGVGAAISPLIFGKLVTSTGDIYWAYWLLALLMLPAILFIYLIPSPSIRHQHADSGDQEKSTKGLLVVLLIFYFLLYVGVEAQYGTFIVTYIESMNLAQNAGTAYQINSIFWGMITVGRFLAIPIASKFKPRRIITMDAIGVVLSILIIFFFQDSILALWIGTILLGLSFASMFPTAMIFAEKQLGLTGKITSYFYLGISVANMFFPWLIGQFFEKSGPSSFITIISILAALLVINWAMIHFLSRKEQTPKELKPADVQ